MVSREKQSFRGSRRRRVQYMLLLLSRTKLFRALLAERCFSTFGRLQSVRHRLEFSSKLLILLGQFQHVRRSFMELLLPRIHNLSKYSWIAVTRRRYSLISGSNTNNTGYRKFQVEAIGCRGYIGQAGRVRDRLLGHRRSLCRAPTRVAI